MDIRWILGGSVLLQVLAALLALRLILITGRPAAWSLIAAGIVLMAYRRGAALYDTLATDAAPPHGMTAELIALGISALVLAGVALIAPTFRAIHRSQHEIRRSRDVLEERVRERTDELTRANESLARQIAEREKIERALRLSEERFRTVSETIAAAVFIYRGSDLIEVNPTASSMTGYSRDELLRMKFWEVLDPDFQELVRKRGMARQAGENVPSSYEVKIRRKDGETRWVTFTAGMVNYEGRQSVIGTAYDITSLKAVEEALRAAEAHQRLILQTVPMAIYTASPGDDQTVLWMSGQVEQISGFPPERFVQQSRFWSQRIHPDDAERVKSIFANLIKTDATAFEYRWKCANGKYRWFLEHPTLLRNEDGTPSEIVGTWLDIHERKTAEEALIQSEKRIQAIIDNAGAVIYVKDLEGRYKLINAQYEKLFKINRRHAVGMTDFDFFPKETAETFRANDRMVLGENREIQFEEVAPHDDGPHTYVSLKFPLYDTQGRAMALCGISTDITERKRFESDIQAAKDAAEAANRAKNRFLANISHEIRTPITAMLGAAERIQSAGVTEQRNLRHTDMILRNGRHLLALVNDLLDLSRLEAGKLEIRLADCSLLEILTDVLAMTDVASVSADLDFQVFFETDIPVTIQTDRTRLTQAIANVVGNARKFTKQGRIHVRVAVRNEEQSSILTVAVEDTGPGIPPEHHDRIFEPFRQGNALARLPLPGAGVGLSLAQWIATQLGGSLELKESSDSGSTFLLRATVGNTSGVERLSAHEASRRLSEGSILPESKLPSLRGSVLLAEDVEDTRALIEEALSASGATVTIAADGRDAIEQYNRAGPFDLILLDIRMPIMDGFAAGSAIRQKGYRAAMIALTASTTSGERDRIRAAGFDDVWTKPISLPRLVASVSAYLETALPESPPDVQEEDELACLLSAQTQAFLDKLPVRLDAIERAARCGEADTCRELLHQLVGSAGIHGLMTMAHTTAAMMQQLDRTGEPPTPGAIRRLATLTEETGGPQPRRVPSGSKVRATGQPPAAADRRG